MEDCVMAKEALPEATELRLHRSVFMGKKSMVLVPSPSFPLCGKHLILLHSPYSILTTVAPRLICKSQTYHLFCTPTTLRKTNIIY